MATDVYYIVGGMDATWGGDARTEIRNDTEDYSANGTRDELLGVFRDVDFDHDGLDNWQEYCVQALRHLRYDDISTPLMGRLLTEGEYDETASRLLTAHTQQFMRPSAETNVLPFVQFDPASPATFAANAAAAWYGGDEVLEHYVVTTGVRRVQKTDASGNIVVVEEPVIAERTRVLPAAAEVAKRVSLSKPGYQKAWNDAGWRALGYFARPPKHFDKARLGSVEVNELPGFFMLPVTGSMCIFGSSAQIERAHGYVAGYATTDPRIADTDGDGMDDYYELFHGLNPILGTQPGDELSSSTQSEWQNTVRGKHGDIIALAYWMGRPKAEAYCRPFNAYFNEWIYPTFDRGAAEAGRETQPSGVTQLRAPAAYDPVLYPWTMGSPMADADGDGVRNDEEKPLANVADPLPTHTDPTPLWFTESTSRSSYTWQYYWPGTVLYQMIYKDFVRDSSRNFNNGRWMFAFEENEGYDTDNDFTPDSFEVIKMTTPYSDPLKFTDPFRRQALWFPGENSVAMSFEPAYRDDGSADTLRQFTVECWVMPEETRRAQTIIERSCAYEGDAVNKNAVSIRANFRIGISAQGEIYGMFDNTDAKESGADEPLSCQRVNGGAIEPGVWSHVAITFDGTELKIYLNGALRSSARTTLVPANGIYGVVQDTTSASTFPVTPKRFKTTPSAFYVGARPKTKAYAALYPYYLKVTAPDSPASRDAELIDVSEHLETFDNFQEFFKGYVDEVRVWDGARTGADILDDHARTLTFDEIKQNREEVYSVWLGGGTRKNNDGNPTLPVELMFHYSFDDLPGAVEAEDVATAPLGFDSSVAAAAENDYISNPDLNVSGGYSNILELKNAFRDSAGDGTVAGGLKVGWWNRTALASTVYTDRRIVPWIQNTVEHLPIVDGTSVDSYMYSEYLGSGYTPASQQGIGQYSFHNEAMPYRRSTYSYDYLEHGTRAALLAKAYPSSYAVSNAYNRIRFRRWRSYTGTTDLVPLGGTFAKRCPQMWDGNVGTAWENSGGADGNGDGIPDWYEEYARNNYSPILDPGASLAWSTLVDYHGAEISAGLAYVIDIARGMLPDGRIHPEYADRVDDNNNNIYDWWERLYGLVDCEPDDDYDSDGLSNHAEFLISFGDEPYGLSAGMPYLDPTLPRTGVNQLVTDYFLPGPEDDIETDDGGFVAGGQYLGEIVTDHDMVENWWEIQYAKDYANPRIYDPYLDTDGDGWDNFSEARAATWRGGFPADRIDRYYSGSDIEGLRGRPQPAIGVKATYFGRATVTNARFVVRTSTAGNGRTDARFVTPAGEQQMHVIIGEYLFDTVIRGNLHPGTIMPGSGVSFSKRDINAGVMYVWYLPGDWWYTNAQQIRSDGLCYGTLAQYEADRSRYGEANVEFVRTVTEFKQFAISSSYAGGNNGYISISSEDTPAETVVGSIDFTTGEYEIDLGKVRSNGVDLDEMVLQASYTYRLGDEWPQTVWMSEPEYGYVRQGANTIEAFFDLNGDGAPSVGEPYGVVENVNIGWHKTGPIAIELKDESAIGPRYDISGIIQTLAAGVEGDGEDDGEDGGEDGGNEAAPALSAVRITRTGINGAETTPRCLFTKTLTSDMRSYLNESDFYTEAAGVFGLDWKYLVVDAERETGETVKSATYLVETIAENIDGTQTVTPYEIFTKEFTDKRPVAATVSPVSGAQVYTAAPLLTFASDDLTATAFEIQIQDSDGALVYDSGVRILPGRVPLTVGQKAVYRFSPAIYAGADVGTTGGTLFEDGKSYKWRVALLNAAHPETTLDESGWSGWAAFCMDVANAKINPSVPTGYGRVAAAVRYYGPNPAAYETGAIVVEAHASADFSGAPLASVRVADTSKLADINDVATTNAFMSGIAPQTVWLVAWIDANGNGKRDAWESWGCANKTGTTMKDVYSPVGVTVTESMTACPSATIFIEDTDVNGNETIDCFEDEDELISSTVDGDLDGDGLSLEEEGLFGLNANTFDTDGDGLPDGWEAIFADGFTDPQVADAYLVSGDPGDVMAYAEVPAAYVTASNTVDGTVGIWAIPAKQTATASGGTLVVGRTPQTGDSIGADEVESYGLRTMYKYGEKNGIGLAPDVSSGDWRVIGVSASKTVVLVHAQVYERFGFDSRTCVAGDAPSDGSVSVNNTKLMTALDKYMVLRYFEALGMADEMAVNSKRKWGEWTLKPGVADTDGDGIPDGWELYTMFESLDKLDATAASPWNHDDARAASPTGLRLLDEYDGGDLPTDPWQTDTDGDGIADDMAFAYHIKGDRMLDDDDGDGLSNYAEYLLSERFDLGAEFDPDDAFTGGRSQIDYFYRTGELYVGEIFTDYDMLDDRIEDDMAESGAANRYAWDFLRDADEDGWTAWEEIMSICDYDDWPTLSVVDSNNYTVATNAITKQVSTN
ncbi:MAG: hypothetical protein IIT98_01935, partial [Kiritimatiellae bacterium]|nr:hypothetical protein [Kiritimatiellia bacterium]